MMSLEWDNHRAHMLRQNGSESLERISEADTCIKSWKRCGYKGVLRVKKGDRSRNLNVQRKTRKELRLRFL